jgi:hypothetical protein
MKMSDVRALEQSVKVLEAAKRLDQEEIKGLTIQVIFDGGGRGQGGENLQMFIPATHPAFPAIMQVVTDQATTAKTDAEAKVNELSASMAASSTVSTTTPTG